MGLESYVGSWTRLGRGDQLRFEHAEEITALATAATVIGGAGVMVTQGAGGQTISVLPSAGGGGAGVSFPFQVEASVDGEGKVKVRVWKNGGTLRDLLRKKVKIDEFTGTDFFDLESAVGPGATTYICLEFDWKMVSGVEYANIAEATGADAKDEIVESAVGISYPEGGGRSRIHLAKLKGKLVGEGQDQHLEVSVTQLVNTCLRLVWVNTLAPGNEYFDKEHVGQVGVPDIGVPDDDDD